MEFKSKVSLFTVSCQLCDINILVASFSIDITLIYPSTTRIISQANISPKHLTKTSHQNIHCSQYSGTTNRNTNNNTNNNANNNNTINNTNNNTNNNNNNNTNNNTGIRYNIAYIADVSSSFDSLEMFCVFFFYEYYFKSTVAKF